MGGTHFESMQYATHLQYITAYPGAYGPPGAVPPAGRNPPAGVRRSQWSRQAPTSVGLPRERGRWSGARCSSHELLHSCMLICLEQWSDTSLSYDVPWWNTTLSHPRPGRVAPWLPWRVSHGLGGQRAPSGGAPPGG